MAAVLLPTGSKWDFIKVQENDHFWQSQNGGWHYFYNRDLDK